MRKSVENQVRDTPGIQSVQLPTSISIDELARTLYPKAFADPRTQMSVLREWHYAVPECAWLEGRVAQAEAGEPAGDFSLGARRKQLQAASLVLQKTFEESCERYFGDGEYPGKTWPAYLMSGDADATSKDWHFFFSVQRAPEGFHVRRDELTSSLPKFKPDGGIAWHVSAAQGSDNLVFSAPRDATYRPEKFEGSPEDARNWAKQHRVLYLFVPARAVQSSVAKLNSYR